MRTWSKRQFEKDFEKKFRKEIRLRKLLKKNDTLDIAPNKDSNTFVARYMLKNLGLPLRFAKSGKKILAWSQEKEIEEFLRDLFSGKLPKKHDKRIKIMKTIPQSEINAFAKLKGYKGKYIGQNNILEFVEKIEKKHGDLKSATAKAIQKIKDLIE
ncbi:hypothetical protein KY335_03010 [Candidatus Woesearchaeota archaeon]|nr:hypothetical protein [Candidatus Woesearchaeota archaeon]